MIVGNRKIGMKMPSILYLLGKYVSKYWKMNTIKLSQEVVDGFLTNLLDCDLLDKILNLGQ